METRAHYVAVGAFVLTMIVLAFERACSDETVLCLFELSGREAEFAFAGEAALLIGVGEVWRSPAGVVRLPAAGCAMFRLA